MAVNRVIPKDLLVCFSSDLTHLRSCFPVSFPPTHHPHPPEKAWAMSETIYLLASCSISQHALGMLLTQCGGPQLSHNFSGSSNSGISAEFPYLVLTRLPSLIRQRNHLLIPRVPEFGGTHSLIRSNYIVGWYQGWLMPCHCFCLENSFSFPFISTSFWSVSGTEV